MGEFDHYRKPVFIGHVAIPSDVDRDEYVTFALRTNTVCVQTSEGEFITNCPVVYSFVGFNDGFFNALDFPQTPKKLGSQIVCLNVPDSNKPLIIGCLPSRQSYAQIEEEEQLKIFRTSDLASYVIEGKGLSGIINLMVDSQEDNGGKINLIARHNENIGEIKLASNYLKFEATKKISMVTNEELEIIVRDESQKEEFARWLYILGAGYTFTDEFNNGISTTDEKLQLDGIKDIILLAQETIKLGDGSQPLLLGDTTQTELNKMKARLSTFLNAFVNAVPVASDGGFAIQTAVKLATQSLQEENFNSIKSEKSFTE